MVPSLYFYVCMHVCICIYVHIYICTLYGSDNSIYYKQQSILVYTFQQLPWFTEHLQHRFHFRLLLFMLLSLSSTIVEHLCSIMTPSSICFSGILTPKEHLQLQLPFSLVLLLLPRSTSTRSGQDYKKKKML